MSKAGNDYLWRLIWEAFERAAAAPHFYARRPVHLCDDGRADDDDGPPNWTVKP